MHKALAAYLQLTKPRIMLLICFAGITALVMEQSLLNQPGFFLLALIALYFTGGAANALNHYFERDKDAKMTRTAAKRPLPSGRLDATKALVFAVVLGMAGIAIFVLFFNLLSAALALATLLFYSLIYTLILKPNTVYNTLIGGLAGATAPLGTWAAASGELAVPPVLLFLVIFIWSPPHFYALALLYKDDYRRANLKMMPLNQSSQLATRRIVAYSILLAFTSYTFLLINYGFTYFILASIANIAFIMTALHAHRTQSTRHIQAVFSISILYLFILMTGLILDSIKTIPII